MPTKIPQSDAKKYVDFYHEACQLMGENPNDVIKYFDIEKKVIDDIVAKAAGNSTPCEKIRIYFAKKSDYDTNLKYPKYSSKDDYNLVVVGVDDKDSNIHATYEIHDHLSSVAGIPIPGDF